VILICYTHQVVCRLIRLNEASLALSGLEEEAFMPTVFDAYTLGDGLTLKNRIVMAPMTRTRTSVGDLPNELMAKYYGQRASAGLIVTEATDVSPHSKGYAWTPGIYTSAQVEGWRLVTNEVHRNGGRIFQQIWHVGRMAHISLLPNGEAPWGVTDEQAIHSQIFAHGADGKLTYAPASPPRQIRTEKIPGLVNEFAVAFKNAKLAGFDGVEIHAANGYLLEQFINSTLNTRTDDYGGRTVETRTRLLLEVIDAATRELGAGKVGVRLSPGGRYGSMPTDPHGEETFFYLCNELSRREVAYLHLLYQLTPARNMEHAEFKEAHLSNDLLQKVRQQFRGTLIWCGGFTRDSAQTALDTGWVDLIAFGRPFIANPDLVARFKNDWPLTDADRSVFYTRKGENGYTDFSHYVPTISAAA
jgi:N-ethylmaleimide reductase